MRGDRCVGYLAVMWILSVACLEYNYLVNQYAFNVVQRASIISGWSAGAK
jgi:hypothetical protein